LDILGQQDNSGYQIDGGYPPQTNKQT